MLISKVDMVVYNDPKTGYSAASTFRGKQNFSYLSGSLSFSVLLTCTHTEAGLAKSPEG